MSERINKTKEVLDEIEKIIMSEIAGGFYQKGHAEEYNRLIGNLCQLLEKFGRKPLIT